ncbi:MAG: hypothetical protein KDD73_06720 [Anaerolineales bacterium]|nr:hypothetical protein [Anaerolineales bacterium]MCB9171813.1 hypothetical protein [Ardenticatenales bacterium]
MKGNQQLRYPRRVALLLWPLTLLLGHIGLPAGLADLTPRMGWNNHQPSAWNLVGLLLVVPSFFFLGWCGYLHFVRTSHFIEVVMAAPGELVVEGPYQWSRNPMYEAGMLIWMGWAIFYGSLAVVVSCQAHFDGIKITRAGRFSEGKWLPRRKLFRSFLP